MINQSELSFGQRIDPDNWLIEPWLVNDAIDFIKTWELKDKNVLEFGAGNSSLWWANKCNSVFSVEANADWFNKLSSHPTRAVYYNLTIVLREINEGSGDRAKEYTSIPSHFKPDIIVNDGILRTEVCEFAVDYFKANGGGILICDNWIQSYVWMSPKAEELMKPFESKVFEQSNHTDNDGINKWKTAIFYIK